MVAINIRNNFPQVHRAIKNLHRDIRDRVVVSAVNKTMEQGRTAMTRAIVAEYNVKTAYVRQRLRVSRARYSGGVAGVQASLIGGDGKRRSANVIAFVERKITLSSARRRIAAGEGGVQALRNGGRNTKALNLQFKFRKTGGVKTIRGAFIGNQGRTVFVREPGAKRLPIQPVRVIDVPQMFNQRRLNAAVRSAMIAKFPEVFAREARFYTAKFNRGGSR